MSDFKLIASDIDGTLILNGEQQISKTTVSLIRRLKKEKNILFIAASGRQYQNLRQLFNPIKNDIIYISENGCLGIYQNKIIYQKELKRELALKIATDILALKDCELQISTPKIQYIKPKTKAFADYMHHEAGIKVKEIADITKIKEPILKVAVYNPKSTAHRKVLQQKYGKYCNMHLGRDDWTDFTPLHTDKGTTLKAIIKHLNIKPKECIAIGDYYNDESMLKAVGCPVAMETAPEELQAIAKFTADSVENILKKIFSIK